MEVDPHPRNLFKPSQGSFPVEVIDIREENNTICILQGDDTLIQDQSGAP